MVRMKPPKVPENPPAVLRDEQLRALLATCDKGTDCESRRDAALLRVFVDTGGRLEEISNLRWNPQDDTQNDLDLDSGIVRVLGKGRRERVLGLGRKTIRALDRYLRRRAQHSYGDVPWLWLGLKGRLTAWGVRQVVLRRGLQAGIGRIHPHQLRHSFAYSWLAEGGSEGDLMVLAGWRSSIQSNQEWQG